MARKSKEIKPLFPMEELSEQQKQSAEAVEQQPIEAVEEKQEEKQPVAPVIEETAEQTAEVQNKNDHQLQVEESPVTDDLPAREEKAEIEEEKPRSESLNLNKYVKQPKYKTYVPHNVRIPRELRRDLEKIAKKLGIPLGKNTGFFQEFTIDALQVAVEKAKKELGID